MPQIVVGGWGVPVEAALVAGGCCRLRQWLLA